MSHPSNPVPAANVKFRRSFATLTPVRRPKTRQTNPGAVSTFVETAPGGGGVAAGRRPLYERIRPRAAPSNRGDVDVVHPARPALPPRCPAAVHVAGDARIPPR